MNELGQVRISIGFEEKWLSEPEIRAAQLRNLKGDMAKGDIELIDAMFSRLAVEAHNTEPLDYESVQPKLVGHISVRYVDGGKLEPMKYPEEDL
jgi:hypothetical protein